MKYIKLKCKDKEGKHYYISSNMIAYFPRHKGEFKEYEDGINNVLALIGPQQMDNMLFAPTIETPEEIAEMLGDEVIKVTDQKSKRPIYIVKDKIHIISPSDDGGTILLLYKYIYILIVSESVEEIMEMLSK